LCWLKLTVAQRIKEVAIEKENNGSKLQFFGELRDLRSLSRRILGIANPRIACSWIDPRKGGGGIKLLSIEELV
jgi:hypothetical protein